MQNALIEVVNNPNGTGYDAHREDVVLAGKTGTAEIKASQTDTSGTELGWFAVYTAGARDRAADYDCQHGGGCKRQRRKRICGGNRINRYWKPGLQAISVLLLAVFLWNTALRAQSETTDWQSTAAEEADWKQIGLDIFRQAAEENRLSDPETVRSLVERFGACGHAAVDSENQVDMVCREQVEAFCEQVS